MISYVCLSSNEALHLEDCFEECEGFSVLRTHILFPSLGTLWKAYIEEQHVIVEIGPLSMSCEAFQGCIYMPIRHATLLGMNLHCPLGN